MLRGERIPAAEPHHHNHTDVTAEFLQKAAGKLRNMETLLCETLHAHKKSKTKSGDRALKEQKSVATAFREQIEYAIQGHRSMESVFLYTAYDLRLPEKEISGLEQKIETSGVTTAAMDECCIQFLNLCHALEDCSLSMPARQVLIGAIDSIVRLKSTIEDDNPDRADIHLLADCLSQPSFL